MIGIDDWAFRRGRRYGTIIVDLERRRPLALLPDRESGTVEAWLSTHPESRSSRAVVEAVTERPPRGLCPMPSRPPIADT